MFSPRSIYFCVLLALWGAALDAQPSAPPLRGYLYVHDPSTIVACNNRYYVFYTDLGIGSKSSADKVFWTPGPPIFNNAPAWTTNAVPGFAGILWAPDVLFFNNQYYLYYAVSTFGSQVSAIGLATSPTLDPTDPAYKWTDQGPVIASTNGSPYNTIDPSFTFDASGNLWMAFGSYWNGIYLVQLNATNGLRISPNSPTYHLAYNSSIEASYIYRRGGYYYLFADWGSCCSGVNSTYNIRMGRSTNVTGPYLDQEGVAMVNNGGTLFQGPTGKFVGPGHVGILNLDGSQWWSYHYYDANAFAPQYDAYGEPNLAFAPLSWTSDNWPSYTNNWSALYRFQADARDDNGQYYGLLENGASTVPDPVYGRVLNLNGTNQYVFIPPGVAYGQTFAAVVKWRGGAQWQRIFDFGFDTTRTVMMTPTSSDNVLRCDLNPGGNLQTVQWTQPLPSNVWTHVAVTFDGTQSILYVNGAAVATNSGGNLLPASVQAQTNTLGQSKFTADPHFNGEYAAFRSYSWALSPQQIVAPLPVISQPVNGSTYSPGQAVNFVGSGTDFAAAPLAPASLNWQVNYIQDGVTNLVYGPVTGLTNGVLVIPTNATGGGIYVFQLTATDLSNRQATVSSTVSAANPPASWSSYYPLQANANDVNGNYNGTLQGGASFVNDSTRGPVLNLSGNGQYVRFPPGLSGMQTFMAWVKWNGGAEWQRIFDFGNDTNRYTVLTPMASSGDLRFNISIDSIRGEQDLDAPGPLPAGVWTHVAVVVNGTSAVIYTNGAPVATNLYANLIPADLNATNIYFGKSEFAADPYFNGQLSSVRIFSRPLASNEITAPQITIAQPAQGAVFHPGDTVGFQGTANDFYDTPIAAASLTWTVNFLGNTVYGPVTGVTNGAFSIPTGGPSGSYQFILTATDSAGRSATNISTIYPAASATLTNWGSYYPFTSGAQDASNIYNGQLQGGAMIVHDPTRGNVLALNGNNEYVSLPEGAGSAQTVSGWVKWSGSGSWQRIFDFGQSTEQFFYLTPSDGSSLPQVSITTDLAVYNQTIEAPTNFPANVWTQVAVVMDGREGILYLNGAAVAVNNSVNLLPSDLNPTSGYFGKSDFSADPYFYGKLSDFALNSEPWTPAELVAPLPVITEPTVGVFYAGGTALNFAGSATDFTGAPLAPSAYSWSGELYQNGMAYPAFDPLTGVTNGSYAVPTNGSLSTNAFYQIFLTVTDTNGYQQTVSTDVPPEITQLTLATFPAGLETLLDGQSFLGTTSVVVGMDATVSAPSPQNDGGTNYNFVLWSDGGAATHSLLIPSTNLSLTASFLEPSLTSSVNNGVLTLSWPQWAQGLDLYTTTNLAGEDWSAVAAAPAISNGLLNISVAMTNTPQFYRLQWP